MKPGKEEIADAVKRIQIFLKQKLLSHKADLYGFESEKKYILDAINKSILYNENNSILLIGPPGSGKSTLTRNVLEELKQNKQLADNFLLVELNGFIHTDDKLSLNAIAKQLCVQTLEEEINQNSNFAENLSFLLRTLSAGGKQSKCIVFVLEEFDHFCQHKTQMVLYNLYDVAQTSQTPIFILGLTCRMDVLDLLEKRVKSRFSHRKIHLFNKMTLTQFKQFAIECLSLPVEEFGQKAPSWNNHIKGLVDESGVEAAIKSIYEYNKDINLLKHLLWAAIFRMNEDHYVLDAEDFAASIPLLSIDSKSELLHGLSLLELSLVIAMMKLTEKYKSFNFEMTYQEYFKYANKNPILQKFNKAVVYKAYEHLHTLELIQITERTTQLPKFKLVRLLVTPSQIKTVLINYPNLPTALQQWANSIDE